ncbi:T9SS type B sorting domain-containing protein [Apibacter sp. HY039]|uniref:T9SS type B sorting domain-containing protein n=1 Tax=Apibacter sp. HY039 TaxID=2501476 RepID=UPI000FEB670D|nr:T9SS type B sorting domain-containing protein [Apibacter sp. HY039]
MKIKYIYSLLLVVFTAAYSYSQLVENPWVKIIDHNGTSDNIDVDCDYKYYNGKTIRLTAQYPVLKQTNTYEVTSINYPSDIDFSKGTAIDITQGPGSKQDDIFSDKIKLPFEFCFYGVKYNYIIISDNGVVSFDISQAKKDCSYRIAGNVPSSGLPRSAIFGVYHDMFIGGGKDQNGKIRIHQEGTAPYRKFTVSYDNVPQFTPINETIYSSSQIVLYETLNVIDVYVGEKKLNPNTRKEKRSVIGIMNSTGSLGVSPPDRNTGEWEASKEAWRFTPNGKTDISVKWFNSNNVNIGTGNSIDVSPSADTSYKVQVSYNGCTIITVEDIINVKFSDEFPTANQVNVGPFCINQGESYTINLKSYEDKINSDNKMTFTYYKNSNLTIPISDEEAVSYSFSSNQTVYVKVLKSGICYSIGTINLKLNKRPVLVSGKEFKVCDIGNDNKEVVNLYSFAHGVPSNVSYVFLDSNQVELSSTSASNYLVDVTSSVTKSQTFYIKAWDKNINDKECYTIVPFTIRLVKKIELKSDKVYICSIKEGQLVIENLTKYRNLLLTDASDNPALNSIVWEFYENSTYTQKIYDPENYLLKLNKVIYVKASHPDFCQDSRTELIFMEGTDCDDQEDPEPIPGGLTPYLCDVKDPEIIDLGSGGYLPLFFQKTSISWSSVEILGFYKNAACTVALPITGTAPKYLYSITPPSNFTVYLKYKLPSGTIGVNSLTFLVSKYENFDVKLFTICDTFNDGEERIDLDIYKKMLSGLYKYSKPAPTFGEDPYDEVIFFDNKEDRDLFLVDDKHLNGMIKDSYYTLKLSDNPKFLYAVVRFNRCRYSYDIQFYLESIEVKETPEYIVCDFNDDKVENINIVELILKNKKDASDLNDIELLLTKEQLEDLKNPISDLYTLSYYSTLNLAHAGNIESATDPRKFELNQNLIPSQMSAYVRLDFKNQCQIIVKINFKFTTAVKLPKYKNLIVCDLDRDNKEKVDLSEIIESSNGAVIKFFTSQKEAENNDIGSSAYIGKYTDESTPVYFNADAGLSNPLKIYMRVDDGETSCFKVLPVDITLVMAPDVPNTSLTICDFENDGKELITSSNIKQYIIDPLIKNNPELNNTMLFEFYYTESQANEGTDKLSSFWINQNTEIWVKIIYNNCFKVYKLTFSLAESPKLNSNILVKICNNNTKNSDETTVNEVVNLNNFNSKFLTDSQKVDDFIFKYYKSYDQAYSDTSKISAGTTVINQLPIVFWVRVEDKNGCFSIVSLKIEAYPELNVNNITDEICNDEKRVYVDLNTLPAQMIGSEYNLTDFNITFHSTKSNAINNVLINTPEEYEVSEGSEVWVKFVYKLNCETSGCCFIIRKISFSVPLIPKEVGGFINICDESDGILDNTYVIADLDKYKSEVVREDPAYIEEHYNFTYYREYEDAVNVTAGKAESPINFTIKQEELEKPSSPTDPLFYRIYIKIDRKDGKCSTVSFLSVNVTSKILLDNEEIDVSVCENKDLNGIVNSVDLTAFAKQIINSKDAAFTYYQNEGDARAAKNPILNPSNYTTKVVRKESIYPVDEVFVRISDSKGLLCDNLAKIKIKVYPFINIENQTTEICEYTSEGNKTIVDLWALQKQMLASIGITDKEKLEIIYKQIRIIFFNDADVEIGRVEDTQATIPETITKYSPLAGKLKEIIKVRFEYKDLTCYYDGLITIEQKNTPKPDALVYVTCDADLNGKYDDVLLKDIDLLIVSDLTRNKISYYLTKEDAINGTSSIDKNKYFEINMEHVYYFRVEDSTTSCIGINTLKFVTHPVISLKDGELEACDSDLDGFTSFNLNLLTPEYKVLPKASIKYYKNEKDAKNANKDEVSGSDTSIQEPELSNYFNVIKYEDYVYVRVEDLDGTYCPSVAKIKLKTYSPEVPEQTVYMCPDTETNLDGGNFDQYVWEFNGRIIGNSRYVNVNQFGIYKLTVTKNLNYGLSCTLTFTIEVKELEKPVIIDLNQGKDYITVIAKGPAPLEYSIDNINWQLSNTFSNLEPGIYTFYVRSKANGCESLTSQGIIFGIYNVITPNNDGYNDVWRMCGLHLIKEPSHVKIFDRYGKLVFEEKSHTCFVWDGKYLGRVLPTASYWYIVTISDGRQYTGWIMLRNFNENTR